MADEEKISESGAPETPPEQAKTPWQLKKESWYDQLPLTEKHLDIIIGVCLTLLGLCFLAIILDAADIYHFFG